MSGITECHIPFCPPPPHTKKEKEIQSAFGDQLRKK